MHGQWHDFARPERYSSANMSLMNLQAAKTSPQRATLGTWRTIREAQAPAAAYRRPSDRVSLRLVQTQVALFENQLL
ncbi:hypothetical protein ASC75_24290 [Aminobacter sp. DSM 101952]|nr:hypothetical protein ASC75_24290 [Aminobacter sp. DSM 101952]